MILKSRRTVAKNTVWSVHFDHIDDEAGNEVPAYLVIEPHEVRPDRFAGVCVLPIWNDHFVLIRCYRHPLASAFWEAPRGFIERNERPEDAARRELAEETGLVCSPKNLLALGAFAPDASTVGARGALFVALDCQGELCIPTDEIGIESIRAFTIGEMETLVRSGEIEDAATLLAYYRHKTGL
jgi:ADP-ribose pyrophosphatase